MTAMTTEFLKKFQGHQVRIFDKHHQVYHQGVIHSIRFEKDQLKIKFDELASRRGSGTWQKAHTVIHSDSTKVLQYLVKVRTIREEYDLTGLTLTIMPHGHEITFLPKGDTRELNMAAFLTNPAA